MTNANLSSMIAYTVAYNRHDFIEWQLRCLRKFCPSIGSLVVVNNGPQFEQIDSECQRLSIRTIRGPGGEVDFTSGPDIARSHASALDIAWQDYPHATERFLIIDSDCFPIKPRADYVLSQADICGLKRTGGWSLKDLSYPSPILTSIAPMLSEIETVSWGPINVYPDGYADTGARFGVYLREHPDVSVRWLDRRPAKIRDLRSISDIPDTWEWEIVDDSWLHFRSGSCYRGRSKDFEDVRTRGLCAALESIL